MINNAAVPVLKRIYKKLFQLYNRFFPIYCHECGEKYVFDDLNDSYLVRYMRRKRKLKCLNCGHKYTLSF